MTTNQLIAKLYDELIEHRGEVPNLASFLRVSCMRYVSLQASGALPEPAPVALVRPERHTLQ
jgi:predicted DNA-binding ribbon-helix-helix protein